jgi:hypothetical protein
VQAQLSQELGNTDGLSLAADWSAAGEATQNFFGNPVAPAGDVNGDGYADLVVGAFGHNGGTGKAYVYHGSASGLHLTANWSAVGEATNHHFGFSVASAGDTNGDGYADVVVGANSYGGGQGKVYVFHGSASGLSATAGWTAVGELFFTHFGGPVASAGDVNDDGYADVVVGAVSFDNIKGKAYIYHGSSGGLSLTPNWTATGEAPSNYFGWSVASAGDVNGDGYADLAVGAICYIFCTGKTYVYHGSPNGLSPNADWSAVGEATGNQFGISVASSGDVNGDGYADLAVGSPYNNNNTGKAYVYLGSAGGLSPTAGWSAVGEAANSVFGGSVASVGDLNGDGYADLAVGATGYNTNTGKTYVYLGSASGLGSNAGWNAIGEATSNYFGTSAASAGDVNGDGFADLVVGASAYNGDTGKAYVYHGSAVPAGCISSCLRVAAIGMRVDARYLYANVTVRDENGAPVPRALVSAHWDLPGGGALDQTKTTSASGTATFRALGGAGTYTISISNITISDYTFDPANSVILSKSITK